MNQLGRFHPGYILICFLIAGIMLSIPLCIGPIMFVFGILLWIVENDPTMFYALMFLWTVVAFSIWISNHPDNGF